MLTLKSLREDPQAVIDRLRVKNFDAKPIVDKVLELDARRRALQMESDALLAEQKKKAAEIGGLMKQGLKDAAEAAKAAVAAIKEKSTELLAQGEQVAAELENVSPRESRWLPSWRTSWFFCPTPPAPSFPREKMPPTTLW